VNEWKRESNVFQKKVIVYFYHCYGSWKGNINVKTGSEWARNGEVSYKRKILFSGKYCRILDVTTIASIFLSPRLISVLHVILESLFDDCPHIANLVCSLLTETARDLEPACSIFLILQ